MDRFGYNQQSVVKKSPVVIVKNFIVLQMAAIAVFFLSGVLIDYGDIYDHLPLSDSLSFHIVEAIGIFSLETLLIFYIFFRWYKDYYEIQNNRIIYSRGILYRRKTVIPLNSISSISYRQGPLGRLTRYGNIELRESASGSNFVMDHIPEPQDYVESLVKIRDSARDIRGEALSIEDLISGGEHEHLEFKTSFRWDVGQNKVNKNLERAVMKTIASFMNSGGGQLLIGVDDSGNIVGLESDYKSLPKSNADGFQNHFNHVFHSMIGPNLHHNVELAIQRVEDKEYCWIKVVASDKPAYLKFDEQEEFYIRTGNGTTPLKLSEASSYIDSHWRARLL
jgi:membrane protein YdbS with pleckstrin-like domain